MAFVIIIMAKNTDFITSEAVNHFICQCRLSASCSPCNSIKIVFFASAIIPYPFISWYRKKPVIERNFLRTKKASGTFQEPLALSSIRHSGIHKPIVGLEPTTYALRMRCSTNWAILAIWGVLSFDSRHTYLLYIIYIKKARPFLYFLKLIFYWLFL